MTPKIATPQADDVTFGVPAQETGGIQSMPHDSKHGYKDLRRVNDAARRAARRRVLAVYDRCAICDQPVDKTRRFPDPWSPEVDEVIPVSKGGSPTDLRNLRLTHRRCNQLKSDKSLEWARRAVRGIEPSCKPTSTELAWFLFRPYSEAACAVWCS